jgi:hypothetical protein
MSDISPSKPKGQEKLEIDAAKKKLFENSVVILCESDSESDSAEVATCYKLSKAIKTMK